MPRGDLSPVSDIRIDEGGHMRPMYTPKGRGIGDVRVVSGEFFMSLQRLWDERGEEILNRTADKFPELVVACMTKLAQVTRVEVGSPGDFTRLGNKEAIIQKLEERNGPKARALFEKFVNDVEALRSQSKAPEETNG